MINTLRNLKVKVDSMQKEMGNENRKMKTLGKNPKEMLEIKNTREMKTAFDRVIMRLNMLREKLVSLKIGQ